MPEAVVPALQATEDFSLIALFLRADPIVQVVMGILALSSVWSWAVAIDKWFSISGARARAKRFEQAFWSGQPMDEAGDRVSDRPAEAMPVCSAQAPANGAKAAVAPREMKPVRPSSNAHPRRWMWR